MPRAVADPLITPSDLGTYLGDQAINTDRAALIISQAQQACERVVKPVPDDRLFVLYRVAARAYSSSTTSRSYQLQQADAGYGGSATTAEVRLLDYDRDDLVGDTETSVSTEAFTIRLNPDQGSPCGYPQFPTPWGCW